MRKLFIDSKSANVLAAGQIIGAIALMIMLLISGIDDARADTAQYYYDPAGRLTAMVDPVNGSAQYSYDAVGNILSVVRRQIADLMVAEVSPSGGPTGTLVTIFGTGFGTTANTTVNFNGQAATPITVSATQITVAVPDGATSGPVAVTAPSGTASSAAGFTLTTAAPTISGVSPSPVDQGATITLSGTGFDPVPSHDKVFINGHYADVLSASPTSITALVPAATPGYVSVMTPNGTATTNSYLVVPPSTYSASSVGSVVNASIGSSATSSVSGAGMIGLILFDATAGQRLAIQVTASSFGGAYLSLYGPDDVAIVPATSASGGTFIDMQVLTRAGTYAVVVAPWPGQTGAMTMNLNNVPPDATAAITANATPVSLTNTVAGQNMSLTFSGTQGQRVSLLTQSNLGCSSAITVTEPDGSTQLYSTSGVCGADFSDALTLPTTGTYTIHLNPSGTLTGSAVFTLYEIPPDASSTTAANGTAVSLTTTVPGQNMSLTFAGTAGQRVSLLTQPGVCMTVAILAPDGATKLYSNFICGSDFSDVVILPTTGFYTIFGDVNGQSVGAATFTLYTVPPDVTGSIAINGAAVSLTTTTPGQNGSLTFSGTAGQRVSLLTQSSFCFNITITAPDGTTKPYSSFMCNYDFSDVLILPMTGSYTIFANGSGAQIGNASFTLYTVPPDVTGTIAINGAAVSLTTTTPGQNASLTFSGSAGQRVSMLTQSSFCFNITITEPDGTTKLYSNFMCNSDFSDVLILPTTGSYTIFANGSGAQIGNASFTLYSEPADASAVLTAGGGSVSLTIAVPGQNLGLTFAGTTGQRVSLLTQPDFCQNLSITAPGGTTSVYSNFICGTDFSGALVLPATGTYTIFGNVSGAQIGTVTFTLYNIPPDVTGATAVGNAAASYTTTVPGQAIRVSFAGAAAQNVAVSVATVTATSGCYRITTLDPDGTTVLRGDLSCSSSYSSGSLTLPQSGTYTVVMAPYGTAIGTYNVGVATP